MAIADRVNKTLLPQDQHESREPTVPAVNNAEEWQLERWRFISEATMAKILEPEEPLELTDGECAEEVAAVIT